MAHTELDLQERVAIQRMLEAKLPITQIAARLGRHRSTVSDAIASKTKSWRILTVTTESSRTSPRRIAALGAESWCAWTRCATMLSTA